MSKDIAEHIDNANSTSPPNDEHHYGWRVGSENNTTHQAHDPDDSLQTPPMAQNGHSVQSHEKSGLRASDQLVQAIPADDDPDLRDTVMPQLILKTNRFQRFLIQLTGGDLDILAQCPTEKKSFLDAAYGLFASMVLGFIAGTFYANDMLSISLPMAYMGGMVWMFAVGVMDTLLIRNMRPPKTKNFLIRPLAVFFMISIRFVLSLSLGYLINLPLEARIFHREIAASLESQHHRAQQNVERELDQTPTGQSIADLKQRNIDEAEKAASAQAGLKLAQDQLASASAANATPDDLARLSEHVHEMEHTLNDTQLHVAIKEKAIKNALEKAQIENGVQRSQRYKVVREDDGPLVRQNTIHQIVFHGDTNGDGIKDTDNFPLILIFIAILIVFTVLETMSVWIKGLGLLRHDQAYYDTLGAYEARISKSKEYAAAVIVERLKAEQREEIEFQKKRTHAEQQSRLDITKAYLDNQEDTYRAEHRLDPRRGVKHSFDGGHAAEADGQVEIDPAAVRNGNGTGKVATPEPFLYDPAGDDDPDANEPL